MNLEDHDIGQLIGIAGIVLSFVLTVIFNAINGAGAGKGIFYNTVGDLSNKYPLDITPDGWAFSIWGIIYFWLGLFIVFVIYSVFKKNSDGLYLYMHPPVIDVIFSSTLSLNFCLNITWIFTWDREQITTSCAVLIFMALTNIFALGWISRSISAKNHDLLKANSKIYWIYVVSMNGLGVYTTWTVVASLLNLGHALRYEAMASMQDTSNVCLSLLLTFCILYFLLENILLNKILRFLITPYIVLIWALSAIVTKEATDSNVNDQTKMFVSALLGINCVLLVLKILLVVLCQRRKPIGQEYDNVDGGETGREGATYGSIF